MTKKKTSSRTRAKKSKAQKGDTAPGLRKALVFDLENTAANAYDVVYDVLCKIFKDKEIVLTEPRFSSIYIDEGFRRGVPRLLKQVGRGRLSDEKLVGDLRDAAHAALIKGELKLAKGFRPLLEAARGMDLVIGAASGLEEDEAKALVERLGIEDLVDILEPRRDEVVRNLTTDDWRRLSVALRVPCSRCLAIASSGPAVRAALYAGMRAMVLTTPYTGYHDFGGAMAISDSAAGLAKEIAKLWEGAA